MSAPDRQDYEPGVQSSILSLADVLAYFANRGKKDGKDGGDGGAVLIVDKTLPSWADGGPDSSGSVRVQVWQIAASLTYAQAEYSNFNQDGSEGWEDAGYQIVLPYAVHNSMGISTFSNAYTQNSVEINFYMQARYDPNTGAPIVADDYFDLLQISYFSDPPVDGLAYWFGA